MYLFFQNLLILFSSAWIPFSFPAPPWHISTHRSGPSLQCHFLHKVSFTLSQPSPFARLFILLLIKHVLVHMCENTFLMSRYTGPHIWLLRLCTVQAGHRAFTWVIIVYYYEKFLAFSGKTSWEKSSFFKIVQCIIWLCRIYFLLRFWVI